MPSCGKRKEFVEGWYLDQTLGEGAYGEVKLLINKKTNEAVAMKIVDITRVADAADNIRKEVCIHRILTDVNIIKFYGQRSEPGREYIFLEYAKGGELFDKIEPDVGMAPSDAQKYFRQLLAGVEYLHQKGITHRDLKPENLLLDADDNLKISDFGMATMFRRHGKRRKLARRCGTLPYVAPEVLAADYEAEPADIWSCGVILVVLLGGELPWDRPVLECKEYCEWLKSNVTITPWTKVDTLALCLLRKILNVVPGERLGIIQIRTHQWMKKKFEETTPSERWPKKTTSFKKICSGLDHLVSRTSSKDDFQRSSWSQPEYDYVYPGQINYVLGQPVETTSLSLPAKPENLLLSSQHNGNGSPQAILQKLVKRMTRFFVSTNVETTTLNLQEAADKLGYNFKMNALGQITITTNDRRNMKLIFKASLLDMQDKILVDFRLSKGDGLEFKRHFMRLREKVGESIIKGPFSWPFPDAEGAAP